MTLTAPETPGTTGSPDAAATDGARGVAPRRRDWRALGLVPAFVLLAAVVTASVALGARTIAPGVVWDALWHFDGSDDAIVVRDLRMPRTLLGLAVGAALGLAGALTQSLTRNPLADPGLLGVEAGAAAAVVTGISLLDLHTYQQTVWFAFAGAALAGVVVFGLGSRGRASATPVRTVLAGVAVTAVLNAYISAVVLFDAAALDRYRNWSAGSLAGASKDTVVSFLPFLAAGVVIALLLARPLDALALGDETGRTLGSHPARTRSLGALAVVLLCGGATAAVGPIVFVGLAVPHAVRLVTGPSHRWLLPYCVVVAPVLVLGCDVLGRLVQRPAETQVGVVTAALGAPLFVYLVRRRKLVQL